uniref:aquaporin-7 isoform X2 n=1 Tax=Ictidomys tridecemlineatus TaxID=43179 RepID=UPI001A9FF5D5|nr:aquaporin-7 isoform X2 [Ictidomys tridecemlineatus]
MAQVGGQRRSNSNFKMVSWSVLMRIQATLQKEMVREFLAEFMSTYVMMVFGLGSVAQMVLGGKKFGSYLSVNLAFGFGVTIGMHVAGNISGAHMNAAVTFTTCALGRMPWRKFPVYVLAAIIHFSGNLLTVTGPTATAGIFATYLPEHMILWRGFLDEMFITGMLQLCLFAITDKDNNPALRGTEALVVGLLIVIIGASLGMNSGYAMNPSRDLPPRFFTFIAGWGKQVFSAGDNWWWVPVVAPLLGAYLGGIIYVIFIGSSIPRKPQSLENSMVCEDHRITELRKTSPSTTSPIDPSIQPVQSLSGSMPLEQF